MAVCAVAVFLNWETGADSGSVAGTQGNSGRVVFVVALAAIALIQVGWRPAWIAAGFVVAVNARHILSLSGIEGVTPAMGLWIGTISAIVAALLLVWDMFVAVSPPPEDHP